eukprot:scaffold1068_cov375-Prasinococcus_capsulatus_cf.AAC.26
MGEKTATRWERLTEYVVMCARRRLPPAMLTRGMGARTWGTHAVTGRGGPPRSGPGVTRHPLW